MGVMRRNNVTQAAITSLRAGFTLIELLIVIAIIAILATAIFTALNPLELFAQSRNAQRWASTAQLVEAVHLYIIQNNGIIPNAEEWEEGEVYMVGTASSGCDDVCSATSTASTCLDLQDLIDDNRMSVLPVDPQDGTRTRSGYFISRKEGSIVTAGVCNIELDEQIIVTR